MLALYRRLFAYDEWANRATLDSLRWTHPSERARRLMAHVASCEQLWLERLRRQRQSLPVWPDLSLDQSETLLSRMASAWREYLDDVPGGLETVVEYTNSKGERWTSSVQDILTHVVMHSAYHRGQIAADVRASGGEPAYTDFIEVMRRGLVER